MLQAHHSKLALHSVEGGGAAGVEPLLREIQPMIRARQKHGSPWFRASGENDASICCALRGDREGARAHAQAARAAYATNAAGDAWNLSAYLQATLEGGPEAEARRRDVLATYAGEGWLNPSRALAMYLPCVDLIAAR